MKCHGTFNRIFTDEQESNNIEHIDETLIKLWKYFPDLAFQSLICDAYDKIYRDSNMPPSF